MVLNPYPTFPVSRRHAAMYRILAYSCPSYASLAFAPLYIFFLVNQPATTKLDLKHGPKTTYFLALVKPKRIKTCLRQGAPSGVLVGSSVLAYHAASIYCTGWSHQGPALLFPETEFSNTEFGHQESISINSSCYSFSSEKSFVSCENQCFVISLLPSHLSVVK